MTARRDESAGEMAIGAPAACGVLYDPGLKGLSVKTVYAVIVTDLRRYRKLATLRGQGLGDMLEGRRPDRWAAGDGVDLDAFYRRCLGQGLVYHEEQGRGLLLGAADFPKAGPLLIITDGKCDRLHVAREHAFLVPRGAHLPFTPKGAVFFVS